MTQEILSGDCLEVMKTFPDNHFTNIITDPPYGLKFMGKQWDHGIPGVEFWSEMLRICKPGSMLAAFGGTRTYHRLTSAIEDAGWEIRDCIMWLYGSGFPKSLNISKSVDKNLGLERKEIGPNKFSHLNGKENLNCYGKSSRPNESLSNSDLAKIFDGFGTALKPAYEPIIIAMKPLDGTFAQNAEKWGVAGLNIDECRIESEPIKIGLSKAHLGNKYGSGEGGRGCNEEYINSKGRWPANLIFDEESAKQLDQQTGVLKSGKLSKINHAPHGEVYKHGRKMTNLNEFESNQGGASRFFYCAKASSSERNAGLEGMPLKDSNKIGNFTEPGKNGCIKNSKPMGNNHPTVKPLSLMQYIIKLLAPPKNALILDPFAGSGSTILAAKQLGIAAIGIEKQEDYCEIAKKRLKYG